MPHISLHVKLVVYFVLTLLTITSTLFPYTTLFRSLADDQLGVRDRELLDELGVRRALDAVVRPEYLGPVREADRVERLLPRSEEHTSELQSLTNLVCRLLLEKKNTKRYYHVTFYET